jgi:hypothetical protein
MARSGHEPGGDASFLGVQREHPPAPAGARFPAPEGFRFDPAAASATHVVSDAYASAAARHRRLAELLDDGDGHVDVVARMLADPTAMSPTADEGSRRAQLKQLAQPFAPPAAPAPRATKSTAYRIPFAQWTVVVGGATLVSLLVLAVVMLAVSGIAVERQEWAFRRRRSGDTDLGVVYDNGQYWWGPDYATVTFPSTWQLLPLGNVSAPSATGQLLSFSARCYYQLRRDGLATLYANFGSAGYNLTVRAHVITSLRMAAGNYSFAQYVLARGNVSAGLAGTVERDLLAAGMPIRVKAFYLGDVQLPPAVVALEQRVFFDRERTRQLQVGFDADKIRVDSKIAAAVVLVRAAAPLTAAAAQGGRMRAVAHAEQAAVVRAEAGRGVVAMAAALNVSGASGVAAVARLSVMLDAAAGDHMDLLRHGVSPLL